MSNKTFFDWVFIMMQIVGVLYTAFNCCNSSNNPPVVINYHIQIVHRYDLHNNYPLQNAFKNIWSSENNY